jgi:hypothetical protein
MALFEREARRKPGTRSNTKLVVSGGDSPAEKWVTDPSLPTLFIYDYAPPAEKEVVVSKGMLVAVGGSHRDRDTGVMINTLTIADGDTAGKHAAGVAPYNFSKQYEDFLYGNQPSIITREYIELPNFTKAEDAAAHKWGAAVNVGPNDFVKVGGSSTGNAGQFVKWDPATDSAHLIVGQVLAVDENQEPFGWLKWAMWDEAAVNQDVKGANKEGYSGPGLNGYPFDPAYRELDQYANNGYHNPYTTDPTGIPGILDGSQKAQTQQTKDITLAKGIVVNVDLGLKNIIDGTVQFNVGSGALAEVKDMADIVAGTFYVDYKQGQVFYHVDAAEAATNAQILFRANFFGTPAGWDAKGAKGVARILLKF